MPTIKDRDEVVLFSDPIKIYLFKDLGRVKISFKVTDYVVIAREILQKDFETILENWDKGEGIQGLEMKGDGKIWWYHSKSGPRPECEPASFAAVNFNRFSFRFSIDTMKKLKETYEHQKNNLMHWD